MTEKLLLADLVEFSHLLNAQFEMQSVCVRLYLNKHYAIHSKVLKKGELGEKFT